MELIPPKVLTCKKGTEINEQLIAKYITKHQALLPRYKALRRMYQGRAEIFNQVPKAEYKPDNRLAVNFAKYIVDTFCGYFNGIPVKKNHEKKTIIEAIAAFDNFNDIEDEDSELAKLACIYGSCFELVYQDEDARTHVVYNSPEDMFMVYDDSIKQEPMFAVRYGYDDDNVMYGAVYTKEAEYSLEGGMASITMNEVLSDNGVTANPYDGLPVVEYRFNDGRTSVFESVYTLINAFNKAISEKSNDVEYFSDQYLAFLGAEIEKEDFKSIRDNRIVNYYGSEAEKVEVKFLDKPDSDTQTENLLDRLQNLIFHTSMIANISDESFGNASGTALAYKLQSMSNLALAFQRKFQSALSNRYRLFLSLGTNAPLSDSGEWSNIEYKFTRNEPKNLLEEAQTAVQLSGITSEETALSVLSVVSDVNSEMERIKAETEEKINMNQFDFEKEQESEDEE